MVRRDSAIRAALVGGSLGGGVATMMMSLAMRGALRWPGGGTSPRA